MELVKQALWEMWGTEEHPAEWDGRVFGGGRCSQRFWEYLWTISNMNIDKGSLVLDIGSGFTAFLPKLLRKFCRCIAVDDQSPAGDDNVRKLFDMNVADTYRGTGITAVTCVSVIEHITDQVSFMSAVDSIPAPVILTFEFESHRKAMCNQLTNKSIYQMFGVLRNHYVSKMERCPVYADDSNHWFPLGIVLNPIER